MKHSFEEPARVTGAGADGINDEDGVGPDQAGDLGHQGQEGRAQRRRSVPR